MFTLIWTLGSAAPAQAAGFLHAGQQAPSFSLLTINHKRISLSSLLGKKPIIINAWASWCPPCQQETPEFVKAAKKYGHDITFVGVNLTSIDSVSKARDFAHKYHIPYPILLDTKGTFRQAYTVIAEPMTFVLTRKGRVVMVYMGALPPSWIPKMIHIALTGKTPHV
ncbi:MAG: TlpA disulfide reductase family protein [Firmicutes bacterium]|nr:TlpA disulfide reductase family protein [Bacillota bacterium]